MFIVVLSEAVLLSLKSHGFLLAAIVFIEHVDYDLFLVFLRFPLFLSLLVVALLFFLKLFFFLLQPQGFAKFFSQFDSEFFPLTCFQTFILLQLSQTNSHDFLLFPAVVVSLITFRARSPRRQGKVSGQTQLTGRARAFHGNGDLDTSHTVTTVQFDVPDTRLGDGAHGAGGMHFIGIRRQCDRFTLSTAKGLRYDTFVTFATVILGYVGSVFDASTHLLWVRFYGRDFGDIGHRIQFHQDGMYLIVIAVDGLLC